MPHKGYRAFNINKLNKNFKNLNLKKITSKFIKINKGLLTFVFYKKKTFLIDIDNTICKTNKIFINCQNLIKQE